MKYFHKEIEAKWQKYWADNKTFAAQQPTTNVTPSVVEGQQPKYYVLDMFPYPSGAGLHVGHPLGYIASDIVARYKRHKGYNVLHPQGYDSFGLPAEQYAIQTGQHPEKTTRENIARYREQLDKIGFSFDWDREVRTSNPDYYKHTQWIFIQLFNSWYNKNTDKAEDIATLISVFGKEGNANVNAACDDAVSLFSAEEWNHFSSEEQQEIVLQYRLTYLAETEVNWCPALGTVLANDEIVNGVSERGGHPVVRKKMKQWSMRISAYAERLLQGLETIDWSESIKEAQRNWIGKSIGASVKFKVISQKSKEEHSDFRLLTFDYIEVFTTRPDTIFGVTFMTLAPEHELVAQITTQEQKAAVEAYIEATAKRSERERMADVKTISGVFTGAYAEHPFTKEPIPIWIGDYVLAGYGTGAVMAVPCGDERDYAFAKHFGIAIKNIFNLTPNPSPTERGAMHSQEASEQKSDFYNEYHYLSANPTIAKKLVAFARENRKNFTEAEDVLWQELRNRKLDDKFRRQHYIGNFIVDFACLSKQLIIEIDGEIHNHSIEYDSERTNILNEIGFQVIRFSNNEVLQQTEKVLNTIKEALQLRPDFSKIEKTPSPLERGQGGEVLQAYTEKQNFTFINSDFLNGLDYKAGTQKVIEELEKIGAGKAKINYRLRDAVFSRQRYWGEPFPVYYVNGLPQMIDAQHLPIVLPEVEKYLPTEDGQPPLGNATHWAWDTKTNTVVSSSAVENTTIFPLELNTMPGWAGSSWYWMRYMDAHNQNEFASKEALSYWQNVDLYIGGSEHATGHLLYSRFWNKFLKDRGFAPTEEPFKKLINQGMILGMSANTYRVSAFVTKNDKLINVKLKRPILISYGSNSNVNNKIRGGDFQKNQENLKKIIIKLLQDEILGDITNEELGYFIDNILIDINVLNDNVSEFSTSEMNLEKFINNKLYNEYKEAILILENDEILDLKSNNNSEFKNSFLVGRFVEKMSKSKYNVVNPDDICEEYGADTLRLYEMFLGPLEQAKPWNTTGITGVYGFLKKLWKLYHSGENDSFCVSDSPPSDGLGEALKSLHKTIKKVTEDIENFSFNTSVSQFMICVNELSQQKCNHRAILEPLAVLISPYAPHIAEELWSKLGYEGSISKVDFPVFEEKYLVESEKEYPVSFNGKMRFTIKLPLDLSKEQIQEIVLADERTITQLAGNTPKNIIIVPGKIINLVG